MRPYEQILILGIEVDFGSQYRLQPSQNATSTITDLGRYSHLITRRLRELQIYSELLPWFVDAEMFLCLLWDQDLAARRFAPQGSEVSNSES